MDEVPRKPLHPCSPFRGITFNSPTRHTGCITSVRLARSTGVCRVESKRMRREDRLERSQEPGTIEDRRQSPRRAARGGDQLQPRSRRRGSPAPPLHPAARTHGRRWGSCAWGGFFGRFTCTRRIGDSYLRARCSYWKRALTPPRPVWYDPAKKLARRCSKHPGPWRHLRAQVMRMDCTTRRPAPDRRRVILVSGHDR